MKKRVLNYLVIAAIVVVAGMGLSACTESSSQSEDSLFKVKWEYMVYRSYIDDGSTNDDNYRMRVNAKLNALGAEGWELVSVGNYGQSTNVLYLKRKL